MITIFSTLVIVFSLFAASRVILRFKSKELSLSWLIIWLALWIAIIFAALVPSVISIFAAFFGTRTADLVIFVGLIFNFYLLFKFYVKIENLRQDITRLVREIAIKNAKIPDEKIENSSDRMSL